MEPGAGVWSQRRGETGRSVPLCPEWMPRRAELRLVANPQGIPLSVPPRDLGVEKVGALIDQGAERPVEVRRGWKVLEVETTHGTVHLATGAPAVDVLQETREEL